MRGDLDDIYPRELQQVDPEDCSLRELKILADFKLCLLKVVFTGARGYPSAETKSL
jgi:hypothetical protein